MEQSSRGTWTRVPREHRRAWAAHRKAQPPPGCSRLICLCFQLTAQHLLATHHCPNWNIPLPRRVSINQQSSLGPTAVLPGTHRAVLHNNLRNFTAKKKHSMWERMEHQKLSVERPFPHSLPYPWLPLKSHPFTAEERAGGAPPLEPGPAPVSRGRVVGTDSLASHPPATGSGAVFLSVHGQPVCSAKADGTHEPQHSPRGCTHSVTLRTESSGHHSPSHTVLETGLPAGEVPCSGRRQPGRALPTMSAVQSSASRHQLSFLQGRDTHRQVAHV